MLDEKTPLRPTGSATFNVRRTIRGVAIAFAFAVVAGACGGDSRPSPTTARTVEAPEPPSLTSAPERQQPPADGIEIPRGDPAIDFEWVQLADTRIGDQVFALGDGFIGYEFPLTTMTVVSADGLRWLPAQIELGSPGLGVEPAQISPGGPGYFGFGMAYDDHILVSDDGLQWEVHDELSLEFPPLGVFGAAEAESLVVGPHSMVLLGTMDRDVPDGHGFFVWASPDGVRWDLVSDAFGPRSTIGPILPLETGFVTAGSVEGEILAEGDNMRQVAGGGERIWMSTDGRSWDEHPDPLGPDSFGLSGHEALAVWGGKLVAVDQAEPGAFRLWASDDGRTWGRLSAGLALSEPRADLSLHGVVAGPLGIVVLAEATVQAARDFQERPPVVVERDGIRMIIDFAGFRFQIVDVASGEVVIDAELGEVGEGTVDGVEVDDNDGSFTITHPLTGARVTFTGDEVEAASERASQEAGLDSMSTEPVITPLLFFSPDGERWATVDIREAFGRDELPRPEGGVIVGSNAMILRWEVRPEFMEVDAELGEEAPPIPEGEPEHVVWVGRLVAP